jgi:translocator protein
MRLRWDRSWAAPAAAGAAWALIVAGLGGAVTDIGPWYFALQQPPWKPPDLWFGPAWTLIYTLTAVALARAWKVAPAGRERHAITTAAVLNGLLNIAWSAVFFTLRRPDWALIEVALLWLSIVWLIAICRRHDRWAPAWLMPYLVWVAFAAALNAAVVQRNAPFH